MPLATTDYQTVSIGESGSKCHKRLYLKRKTPVKKESASCSVFYAYFYWFLCCVFLLFYLVCCGNFELTTLKTKDTIEV